MTNASVSFSADVLDDGHYSIVIAQTGPDTADLNIRRWAPGADVSQPAESEESYSLSDIRDIGNKITCNLPTTWFVTPQIEVDLSAPDQQPSVTVVVSHSVIGNGTKVYPVSQADRDRFAAFQTAFPAG